MYISWTIFCLKEASAEKMEQVHRIMESVDAVPEKDFRVDSYWKEPRINRIGRAYRCSRLPEDLKQRMEAMDPEATMMVADQDPYIEYLLSSSVPNIISSPARALVACCIHKNL